jgi:hypothetical protein
LDHLQQDISTSLAHIATNAQQKKVSHNVAGKINKICLAEIGKNL